MSTEAIDRNGALEFIHSTKLPSYAVWDNDSISKLSRADNYEWWVSTQTQYHKSSSSSAEAPIADLVNVVILKWIRYYAEPAREKDPEQEYCSKRQPYYLNCDI